MLLNFAALLAYQHYLAGDFPFQDEWGYLNRLQHVPQNGLGHYLFDRYQTYYIPVYLFTWYLFYAFAHLNIMIIRYSGAAMSAIVSLELVLMLYQKAARLSVTTLVVILSAPFLICSYNHWAFYNQSIESFNEPLLFGLVLAATWVAEKTLATNGAAAQPAAFGSALLCVAIWLVATGIYAPALVLLPAITAARACLYRKIDPILIVLAVVAVALPIAYLLFGSGLHQGWSVSHTAFGFDDFLNALVAVLGLTGNALFSPGLQPEQYLTRFIGACILFGQAAATVYALRSPAALRGRFMIPLTLTFYNLLVLAEVIATRLHYPDVAFTPRYSMFMLGGPVSLLFWGLTVDAPRLRRALIAGTLVLVCAGTALATRQTLMQLPYTRAAMARVRATLMSLQAQPTPQQQADMYVNPPLLTFIYPGRLFLEDEHLAMYASSQSRIVPVRHMTAGEIASADGSALQIVDFGPGVIRARTPFNIQPNGESALWIRLNHQTSGRIYVSINGKMLPAAHHGVVVAVAVPPVLFGRAGSYPMFVLQVDGKTRQRSSHVSFVVQ